MVTPKPVVATSRGILGAVQGVRECATTVASVMNYIAGWGFIFCAFFVTADVLLRAFAGFSSKATTEITGYLLAFGIAWGLAHTLAVRAHIRVDVLVNRVPLRWRQWLHAFALTILTGLSCFMTWCAWSLVQESILFNAKDTSALAVPLVVPQGLWAIGITMLATMAVVLLVEVVCRLAAGDAAGVDALLGPRTFEDETEEALEAVGITPSRAGPSPGDSDFRSAP